MPRVQESVGDIFSAPPNSVLLHACNCRGVWGNGVALEFKKRFPRAFQIYNEYCNTPPSPSHQRSLLGTTLLIPPQSVEEEENEENDNDGEKPDINTNHYWIACVFTSLGYGRTVSSAEVILDSTKKGMGDLHKKLSFLKASGKEIGDVWAVKINSGMFGVQWDRTKRILEQCAVNLKVVRPVEEGEDEEKEDTTIKAEVSGIPKKDFEQGDPATDGPKPNERKRKSVDEEDGEAIGNQGTKDVAVDKKKKRKKKTADEKRLKQS
ncbi:MAG: hypothetical protein Q9187_002729 [Circinaria calcarea]